MKPNRLVAVAVLAAICLAVTSGCAVEVNQWRTMASLRRVDEHPLYVMTYYGDYGFRGVMQQSRLSEAAVAPYPFETALAWACTCFAVLSDEGDVLLARNFDWYDHAALLLFTDPPDGYASVSMVDVSYLAIGRETPSWGARRRLLEAPHMPLDGMNERGLGVGMMAVPDAAPSRDPQKMSLDTLQVIRLLLDYAQDVDEALSLVAGYNVDFSGGPPVHYLIVDSGGHSAVVEFVDGQMKVLRNEETWQVSTNFVISEARPEGARSECWRYNIAFERLQEAKGRLTSDEAMALLKAVSQNSTIWSLVYDLSSGAIQVVMSRDHDHDHRFKLGVSNVR